MCAEHKQKTKSKLLSKPLIYGFMILLGVYSGMSDIVILKDSGLFIADVFIKIFKCISLPIIGLSIIVTLSNYQSQAKMRSVWRRTLFYSIMTTIFAATVSFLLYLIIQPESLYQTKDSSPVIATQGGYLQHIANLIPSSVFSPFLEQQVFSVLFMGILIGIAIRYIPERDARETVRHFFRGLHGLLMVITKWIITIIPIGLFGFITSSVVQIRSGVAIKGIGEYLLVIVLANLIQGFVVIPLWLKLNKIKPFASMKAMLPALSLAFFSKSSVGTLPVTMDTVEKNLDVKPEVSRFVLPFCTSINMNGCAAFIFVTVVYLMQNHGIHLNLAFMALWVIVASVAALGNAGVPMGCFFLSASLAASMNVPITLMGIILPFYSLIDMLETALNVWSDASVAKVVDEKLKAEGHLVIEPLQEDYRPNNAAAIE